MPDSKCGFAVLGPIIFTAIFLNAYTVIGCLIEGFSNDMTFESFSFMISTIFLGEMVLIKMYYMHSRHRKIKQLLYNLEFGLLTRHSINLEEQQHIMKADSRVHFYSNLYIWFMACGAMSLNISPLFEKLFRYLEWLHPRKEKKYPFPIYILFDDTDVYYYALAYFGHWVTCFDMLFVWIGSDILFISIIVHITAHFRILGERIKNLDPWGSNSLNEADYMTRNAISNRTDARKLQTSQLKGVVQYHSDLIE